MPPLSTDKPPHPRPPDSRCWSVQAAAEQERLILISVQPSPPLGWNHNICSKSGPKFFQIKLFLSPVRSEVGAAYIVGPAVRGDVNRAAQERFLEFAIQCGCRTVVMLLWCSRCRTSGSRQRSTSSMTGKSSTVYGWARKVKQKYNVNLLLLIITALGLTQSNKSARN